MPAEKVSSRNGYRDGCLLIIINIIMITIMYDDYDYDYDYNYYYFLCFYYYYPPPRTTPTVFAMCFDVERRQTTQTPMIMEILYKLLLMCAMLFAYISIEPRINYCCPSFSN